MIAYCIIFGYGTQLSGTEYFGIVTGEEAGFSSSCVFSMIIPAAIASAMMIYRTPFLSIVM